MTKTPIPAAPRGTSRPYTRTSRAHAPTRNTAAPRTPPKPRQFDGGKIHRCIECVWFDLDRVNGSGVCHRFAPRPTEDGDGYLLPRVPCNCWCGLWQGQSATAETDATATAETIEGR